MKWPWTTRAEREAARRLEREKSWWRFQLYLDFMYGKVTVEERNEILKTIEEGIEYVGVARRR